MRLLSLVWVGVLLLSACGPSNRPQESCNEGETRCTGLAHEVCSGGTFVADQQCQTACDPTLGCTLCTPNTGTCAGDMVTRCLPDGSGYETETCDPTQGLICDPGAGDCVGACSAAQLGTSYLGCDYYPVITPNVVSSFFAFAVTVSNTGAVPADIRIEGPNGYTVGPMSVAAGAVQVFTLPWTELQNSQGGLYAGGAYHLRSTQPVTVYQFSPLDYTDGVGSFSYTNDASLLLPVHRLGMDYVVAAFPGSSSPGSFLAIAATQDNTTVMVTSSAPTSPGNNLPILTPGTPTPFTLMAGDELLINAQDPNFGQADMTGTRVTSDKPIQVTGGHYCTFVPLDIAYCDHLEESMFPVETLGFTYAVTDPAAPPLPNGKQEVIRIVGTENDTQLTFDPPQAGVPTTVGAGQFVELSKHLGDFVVTANHKILVAQYMEGQDAGGNTGDPALTLAVATDQYRSSYLFHAPLNYEVNYVNITAPVGTQVNVDDQAVTVTQAIGGSGMGVVRLQLGQGQGGNHTAQAGVPFGISVYGYGQYTSYWYPGGLDLREIVD